VPLNIIQRQLGHVNLGTTSIYLQGIDTEEIIAGRELTASADKARQRRSTVLKPVSERGAHVGSPFALPIQQNIAKTTAARPCESQSLCDPCASLLAEAELKRQSVRVGDDEPILTEPLVRPPAPAVWIRGRGAQAGLPADVPNGQRLCTAIDEQ
jgi:hypothetical protein